MERVFEKRIITFLSFCLYANALIQPTNDNKKGFQVSSRSSQTPRMFKGRDPTALFANEKEEVELRSKEYLEGFLSSPIQDESVQERGGGLEQGLKLAGSATIILGALFLGFMASNGLL
jgi:hypothetical protein